MTGNDAALPQNMLGDWAAAVRENDIEGEVRHHSDDFLMFDVVGDRQLQGLAAYRKSWLEEAFSPGTDRPENSSSTISGFRPAIRWRLPPPCSIAPATNMASPPLSTSGSR